MTGIFTPVYINMEASTASCVNKNMGSDSSDEEDFVSLGTPVPEFREDEPKKLTTTQDLTAKDKQGRRRFHGAFTGGFSAGFFNTVGTKEGFTPSTFVSSRSKKLDDAGSGPSRSMQPEDFMDEEDLEEYGIAPRKFATVGSYTSEERKRKYLQDANQIAGSSVLNKASLINDLFVPEQLTVGIKLLRKMGWREGQGLGPRVKQNNKKKKKHSEIKGVKIYGCAPPPSDDSDLSDSFVPEDMSSVMFAPKDVSPISVVPKENVHGLGYRGLDPALALPSSHINLFSAPPVCSKKSNKGIAGQAFGVGAFEDEDEDIYAVDSLSNYDITMQPDNEERQKFGWTAPREHGKQSVPVTYIGKLLEGFCLSKAQLKPRKRFPAPILPPGFKPHHWFRKQRELSHIPAHLKQDREKPSNHPKLNAVDRGILLGETPVMNSVFDLVTNADRDRIEATKEAISMTKSLKAFTNASAQQEPQKSEVQATDTLPSTSTTTASKFLSRFQPAKSPNEDSKENGIENNISTPLFQNSMTFQPFRKDPTKQCRYERYLASLRQGVSEPYNAIASENMTEWERARERDEFSKAAKMFRPMSAMMSSRFVSGTMIDDDMVETSIDPEKDKTDEVKAVEMKMFGKLTREEQQWHPHQLLCKRFNVPNPFPGSDTVGVPGVKRDKYSVFDFLSMGDYQPGDIQEPSSTDKEASQPKELVPKGKAKKATLTSVFKVLDDPNFHKPHGSFEVTSQSMFNKKGDSSLEKSTLNEKGDQDSNRKENNNEEETPADIDLFRAIFKNSDSEDSDKESENEMNKSAEMSSEDGGSLPDVHLKESKALPVQVKEENANAKTEEEREVLQDSFRPLFTYQRNSHGNQKGAQHQLETYSEISNSVANLKAIDKNPQWKSQPAKKSVFSVLEDINIQENLKSKEVPPSSKKHYDDEGEVIVGDFEAETYGPSLPPLTSESLTLQSTSDNGRKGEKEFNRDLASNSSFISASFLSADFKTSRTPENTKSKSRGRKESKSSHKKAKRKKSKHQKQKKRKKSKKSSKSRKNNHSSPGSEADTESDSDDSVSDSELLERLRDVSKSTKPLDKIKF